MGRDHPRSGIEKLYAKLQEGLWKIVVTWQGHVVYAQHEVDLESDQKIQDEICGDGLRPHWGSFTIRLSPEKTLGGNVCDNKHCTRVKRRTPCVEFLEPIGRS
jgi:hypothetical protein